MLHDAYLFQSFLPSISAGLLLSALVPEGGGGWKDQKKLISGGRGVGKCCETQDNTAMKHSMFINQASMVVRILLV